VIGPSTYAPVMKAVHDAVAKMVEQLAAHVDEKSAGDEELRQYLVNTYIIRAAVVHEDGQWKARAWIDIRDNADGDDYVSYMLDGFTPPSTVST
jgi:hypothetical protein